MISGHALHGTVASNSDSPLDNAVTVCVVDAASATCFNVIAST